MPKFKLVALTHPVAGKEDAYNEWYSNVHLPEVISAPGFTGAQRFRLKHNLGAVPSQPYLAIYDIEADDPMTVMAAVGQRPRTDSDAIDSAKTQVFIVEELGPWVKAKHD